MDFSESYFINDSLPHLSVNKSYGLISPDEMFQGPGHRGFADKTAACGRLVCDIKLSAKELIRSRSYDLTELTNVILKSKRCELDYDQIRNMYM